MITTTPKVTYKFSGIEEKKHKYIQDDYKLKYLLEKKAFYDKKNDTVLMNTNDKNITWPILANGLLNTMMIAYNEHTPLTLRPDDLWITIVIVFMKYIDRNLPDGKQKLLEVDVEDLNFSSMDFWLDFTESLRLKMGTDIADSIIPTFSTTTTTDRIITNIALMSGFKKMFLYQGTQCCGLSEITLEGTEEDWSNLITKTKQLFTFGDSILTNWSELLIPILEQFHNLYMGKVDEDFWQRICTYKTRGSGGDKYFRGWFLVFGPFNVEGEYILRPREDVMKDNIYANDVPDDEIADTQVDVDVKIKPIVGDMINVTLWALTATNHENNMLTMTSDFVAIQHQHITYDMFKEAYLEILNKYDKNANPEKIAKHNSIIDFSYFVAVKCAVPNNLFVKLVNKVYAYAFRISDNIYKGVFDTLSHKYGEFSKYIKLDQMEIIVSEYITI